MRVADLGCGQGELGAVLLPSVLPGGRVDGFDADPDQVAAARQTHRNQRGLRFEEADARSVPKPDGSYDLAVCQALLTHTARPWEVLDEMLRLVRPGGWIATIEPDGTEAIRALRCPHTDADLTKALLARFEAAAAGAARGGLGRWTPAERDVVGWMEAAGLVEVTSRLEPGQLRLRPPYSAEDASIRDALLGWESEAAASAEDATLRWLAAEGGLDPAALEDVEARAAAARRSRARDLRAGRWDGVVAVPLVVTVGRVPAGAV